MLKIFLSNDSLGYESINDLIKSIKYIKTVVLYNVTRIILYFIENKI